MCPFVSKNSTKVERTRSPDQAGDEPGAIEARASASSPAPGGEGLAASDNALATASCAKTASMNAAEAGKAPLILSEAEGSAKAGASAPATAASVEVKEAEPSTREEVPLAFSSSVGSSFASDERDSSASEGTMSRSPAIGSTRPAAAASASAAKRAQASSTGAPPSERAAMTAFRPTADGAEALAGTRMGNCGEMGGGGGRREEREEEG